MPINLKHSKAYIFIVSAILISALETLLFSFLLPDNSTVRLRTVLFIADASLLYLIYWFTAPRARATIVALSWLLTAYLISNSLYFAYWGDMYTLPSIFRADSYNSFVLKGGLNLWSWPQTIMLLASVAVTALYIGLKPYRSPRFTTKTRLTATAATVAVFALGFFLSARSVHNWYRISGQPEHTIAEVMLHRYRSQSYQVDYFRSNGLTGYLIAQIVNYPHIVNITLSDAERQSIDMFVKDSVGEGVPVDSVFSANAGKNLIFIVVESLNAHVIDKKYGNRQLTPRLNSLIREEGTVSALTMYAQIGHGGSSDGQLIYNTGLLPVSTGVTVQDYISATYPSLVKTLRPASSAEFIVESAMVYNHRASSQAFGYDSIFDKRSLESLGLDINAIGADRAVFAMALNKMAKMPQPFVAEITTLSMHYPFDICGFEPAEWIDSIAPDDYYLSHYLQTVHYTDAAIGEFIDHLKATPLWPNTVVVIASDHDTTTERHLDSDESPDCQPIVFMALNTGTNLSYENAIGQIDVFPTVLDIMGIQRSHSQWRGLGRSIFAGAAPCAAVSRTGQLFGASSGQDESRLRRAFAVSDSIIRADYFKTKATR